MKKLTAGIFSVLMGLVAVNAADAAVASKGYVTGQINAVNAEVAKKVDQSAYDTTIAALNEKDVSQDAEIAKRTVFSVAGDGLKLTEGVLTLDGIATSAGLSALEGAVEILNAEADQTGSVKQQIAAEAERTNTAIADAIAAEVERTDDALALKEDLANKYQEADKPAEFDSWDQATQQAWLKQHYASVNYVDAQIDQVAGTAADLSTTVENLGLNKQDKLSSLEGGNVTVTGDGVVTGVDAEDGEVTFTKSLVTSEDIATKTILDEDIAEKAVSEEKLSQDVQNKLNAPVVEAGVTSDTETQSLADGQYALTKTVKDGVVSYHWDLISY